MATRRIPTRPNPDPKKETRVDTHWADLDDSPRHAPDSGEPTETGPRSLKARPIGDEAPRTKRPEERSARRK